jgi:chemotaxis protein CheD
MVVKIVGGANILDNSNYFRIGQKNITALRKIFWRNNVLIDGEDIGGDNNRTIQMDISTGKVVVKNSSGILREL